MTYPVVVAIVTLIGVPAAQLGYAVGIQGIPERGPARGERRLSAAACISMAGPMVVFFAGQQFFVRGIRAGAITG